MIARWELNGRTVHSKVLTVNHRNVVVWRPGRKCRWCKGHGYAQVNGVNIGCGKCHYGSRPPDPPLVPFKIPLSAVTLMNATPHAYYAP